MDQSSEQVPLSSQQVIEAWLKHKYPQAPRQDHRSSRTYLEEIQDLPHMVDLFNHFPVKTRRLPRLSLPLKKFLVRLMRPIMGVYLEKQVRINRTVQIMACKIAVLERRCQQLESRLEDHQASQENRT